MSGKHQATPGQFGRLKQLVQDKLALPLVRNTIYYGFNFGLQIITQFGFFALISRELGISGYGVFASATAVALIISVFVGWGSDQLLIQRLAVRKEDFPLYFGRSLALMLMTIVPMFGIGFGILYFLDTGTLSFLGIACILAAECIFRKITFLCAATYMAHDRAGKQFVIDNAILILRLLAVVLLALLTDEMDLNTWALWYVGATVIAASGSLLMVLRDYGLPKPVFSGFELKHSFLLTMEFASSAGMRDLDKPVIVETLGAGQAGIYTAAFRIIDAATAPVRAVLFAAYTRYFRHADKGAQHGIAFGLKMLPVMSVIGISISIFVLLVADYVPLLIGEEYNDSVGLIKMLAIYPLIIGAGGISTDIMRSIGLQSVRVVLVFASNFGIVGMVFLGAMLGDLEGAVIARIVMQLFFLAISWIIISRKKT